MITNIQLLRNTQKYRKTPKGVLTNMYNHMKNRNKVDFSLLEFQNTFLTNEKYLRLFNNWSKSGYKKQLRPSLDRIDSKKHYSFDNVQMLTWAENRFKQSALDGKRGRKPAVLQMLGDKVIKRFSSQRMAIKQLGINQGDLSMVLNGRRKTVNGYNFLYENPKLLNSKQGEDK